MSVVSCDFFRHYQHPALAHPVDPIQILPLPESLEHEEQPEQILVEQRDMRRIDVELRGDVEQRRRIRVKLVVTYANFELMRQMFRTPSRTCSTVRCSNTSRQITRS